MWPASSIVYYVGTGIESWGPDSIEQGIGGSEEAVIYLSRELARAGWKVTVFCQREDHYEDEVDGSHYPITYKPYCEINARDTFNVFIASRHPEYVHNIKARLKLVDLHDAIPESNLLTVIDEVDKFMVKSKWHRDLYQNIPDDKFVIIGNGIVKEQFDEA